MYLIRATFYVLSKTFTIISRTHEQHAEQIQDDVNCISLAIYIHTLNQLPVFKDSISIYGLSVVQKLKMVHGKFEG
jgi:hypothetical protein